MKRIKQIIEALRVLSRTPSKTILQSFATVIASATEHARSMNWTEDSVHAQRLAEACDLVENFGMALSALAEDMEKPAKAADGEVKA